MNIGDLYKDLAFGALSNLAVAGSGDGIIPPEFEPKLISHLNQSLLTIYGRFLLDEKEVVIRAIDNRTIYPLRVIHADQNSTTGVDKFIADSVENPFFEDVIKILNVYDEEGEELVLNDPEDTTSLWSPNPYTLQIPKPVAGNAYYVMYQARHPILVEGNLAQEIMLSPVLYPALEAHVAYRLLTPMSGQENSAKALEYLQTYMQICKQVEEHDLLGSSLLGEMSSKFRARGFI